MSRKPRTTARTRSNKPFWNRGTILAATAAVAVAALLALPLLRAGAQGGGVAEFMHLHGLAIAPWAPDDVFVSSHQGLMRIDAEGDWSVVSERPHDFMGFQANPTEEDVLYSSGHPAPGSNFPNPVGFMVSEDAGRTWTIRSLRGQVDFHVMAVQPSDGDVVYGLSRGLMRSTDAGANWQTVQSPQLARMDRTYALAVSPDDADTLLLGTGNGLWRSEDGGRSWSAVLRNAPVTAVAFGQGRIFAYVASVGRGLTSSSDGDSSWTDHDLLLEGDDALAYIAPHPSREGTVVAGSFGQNIYRTSDLGGSWEILAEGGVPQAHDHDDHQH